MPNDLSAVTEAERMSEAPDPHAWIGRIETRSGVLSRELAGMLAAALSHPASAPVTIDVGAPMPPLWHWSAFPEFVPMSGLGEDGHPRLGGFLPPIPYPRRMWAGGRIAFSGRLTIGERLTRRSEITGVEFKTGGSGEMAFVRVRHRIRGEGGGTVDEDNDIVYLPMPDSFRPPRPVPGPTAPTLDETVEIGTARLFRYSAATFNAHRIHYDLAYARGVEKYPDLIVHGPMQATLLLEAAIRHTGRRPARFEFRGVHPMFAGESLRLTGVPDGSGAMRLATVAPAGHQGFQARVEWE